MIINNVVTNAPRDTLAYQRSRVLSQKRAMSGVMCWEVAGKLQQFMDTDTQHNTNPETEALWFYFMNHALSEVQKERAPLEPLGSDLKLVESYYNILNEKAVRAFYYLLLICIRESRHLHNVAKTHAEISDLYTKHTSAFNALMISGNGEKYSNFIKAPPDTTIGNLCSSLRHIFYKGSFSKGYGGKAWGQVADCLVKFVNGTYSAEVMLDTVWTLSHNNGPIFNKGMLYINQHTITLRRVLDVQRAGQIPTMILTDVVIEQYVPQELKTLAIWMKGRFPNMFLEKVDWVKVVELGSLGKYHYEMNKEILEKAAKAYVGGGGAPPWPTPGPVKGVPAFASLLTPAITDETHFTVMPGLVVPKFKMPRSVGDHSDPVSPGTGNENVA